MTRSWAVAILSAVATALLAACDDAPTGPRTSAVGEAQISTDLASISADAVAAAVDDIAAGEAAAGLAGAAAGSCPYDAATKYHVCARVTERGLELVRRYQFRDASGTPTETYSASTTASVNFLRTADGNLSATTDAGVSWTRATHQTSDRTVSGLAGPETQRVWNGAGTSADTSTHAGATTTRRYAATVTTTERDVVVKLPRSTFPWPQSGTITQTTSAKLTVEGARDGERTVTRTSVVTFNGTATVPLTINNLTCTLNLETHQVSGCTP